MARKKQYSTEDKIVNFMNMGLKMAVSGSSIDIADQLNEDFDVVVQTGQKRTVPLLKDSVLKLVTTREGLDDNINEILTSEALRELNEKGKITDEEIEHFALVDMVNDDPFTIRADRFTLLKDSERFKTWKKENKDSREYVDESNNRLIGYWLLTDKHMNEQCRTIMTILSKFTRGSDYLPWKVIENLAIDEVNDKLVFIDMGSILPKYDDVDVACSQCGGSKKLLVVKVDPRDQNRVEDAMEMRTGLYACTKDHCSDHYSKMKLTKSSNNVTDSVVFDEYQKDAKNSPSFISDRANLAKIFLPNSTIEDFSDFKDQLREETGEKFSGDEIKTIWRNSIPYISVEIVGDAVHEIDDDMEEYAYDDFDEFKEMIYEKVNDERSKRRQLEDNDIIDIYAAIMYLKYHITESNEKMNMFTILSSEDKSEFMAYLNSLDSMDEDDHDDLWNILSSFI